MKIRIITNSDETLRALNAISNINLTHGFSFGPDQRSEVISENSWFTNVLKNLDSKFSKFFPLREKEKLVVGEIANSAKKLNDYLATHNTDIDSIDYLNNSSLFIHSDSSFNKSIRNFANKLALYASSLKIDFAVYPDSSLLKKVFVGVQYVSPCAFLETRKIVMNSSVFSKETDLSSDYNFLTDLSDKVGTQKVVDFTFLHEFAHITQDLNAESMGINSDIKIFKMIKNINSLAWDDFYYQSVQKQIDEYILDPNNNSQPQRFVSIDRDLIRQLSVVQREIYADVGGLLHMRNIALNENNYSQKEFSEFIDHLIQARHNEHNAILNVQADNVDKFDHFTIEGLKVLKEKLETISQDKMLSQEEIHDICQDSLTVGLSRKMLILASINHKFNSQIQNLFYLDRVNFTAADGKEYPKINLNLTQEDNSSPTKYIKGMEHLKKLAGKDFVDRLTDTVHTTFSLKAPAFDIRQITWKAVFENPSYKNDLQELKSILDANNKLEFKVNNPEDVVASVSNLRSSYLRTNSKNKHSP